MKVERRGILQEIQHEKSFSWDLNNSDDAINNTEMNYDFILPLLQNKAKEFAPATRDKFFVPKSYSRSYTATKFLSSGSKSALYTPAQVQILLQNPYKNHEKLKEVSNYLWASSPTYQNYLYDISTTMTFDYLLYNDDNGKDKKEVTVRNRFMESARLVRNAQVKTNYPMMLLEALKTGEAYYYLQDEGNVIYDLIPSKICQLAFVDEDNLWRYWIDLAYVTTDIYVALPPEIKQYYKEWVDGDKDGKNKKNKKKVEKEFDGERYLIPASYVLISKKGSAIFSHMHKVANDYPYYASMFPDLLRLEENKTFFNEVLKDNNIKTIHFKVPLSADGIPLMDGTIVGEFHDDAVRATGNNVSIITNPFEAEAITLDKSQQAGINLVDHSTEIVSNDSGISRAKFNADSTNGLKYSVNADFYRIAPLRYFFENILNYRLKTKLYKVTFFPCHRDNVMEYHDKYTADLLNGGSRFAWLSTSGLEAYEYIKTIIKFPF